MNLGLWLDGTVTLLIACPILLFFLVGVPAFTGHGLSEARVAWLSRWLLGGNFLTALVLCATYWLLGLGPTVVSLGAWFSWDNGAFTFDLIVDGLSVAFVTLTSGICSVVAAFSVRYLHRDPGYQRYFIQLSLFALGLSLVGLAGSVEVLLSGWELVGLSSALLIAFFHERPAPVNNALRVLAIYRTGDAAMLAAAVMLHHWAGSGSLGGVFTGQVPNLDQAQALVVALLFIVAVCGKSALLPFSGWLPRAMEGPTPSSAVYYGALSIHAGCFLLLRIQPLLLQSLSAQVVIGVVGAATAVYATLTARVQTDIKSALAYASLSQVGVIVLEIALGLSVLPFLHMVGHICFRVLQLLSAPNVLHDLAGVRDARAAAPPRIPSRLYLLLLERGFLDSILDRYIVAPSAKVVATLDRLDRFLSGNSVDAQSAQGRSDS